MFDLNLVSLAILIFICIEFVNVLALYFRPGSTRFNAVGIFNAWEKSKQDPELHDFVRYLVYWVAGTKLIFIMLLLVIFVSGDSQLQNLAVLALILSIATFFWRLFPLIQKMDKHGYITPSGYSKILGIMIFTFLVIFISSLVFDLVFL